MDIKAILREMKAIEGSDCSGGVPDSVIDAASTALRVPFPRSYREFLRHCGAGCASFQEFIGLGGEHHLDVVRVTQDLRARKGSGFSLSLLPVLNDGGGNYECIDTAQPTGSEEFRVVRWLHDGGEHQLCESLADSYVQWLWDVLQAVKREDDGTA
jgi:SUKH superfamily protein